MAIRYPIVKINLSGWTQDTFSFTSGGKTFRAGSSGMIGGNKILNAIFEVATGGISQAPDWGDWSFGGGIVSQPYSHQWDMVWPQRPITYSVPLGSLPTGLSLVSTDGHSAGIQGTPTVAGTYSFTLRASNTFGVVDKAFSITISAAAAGGFSRTFAC